MKLLHLLIESIRQKRIIYNIVQKEMDEIDRTSRDLSIPKEVITDSFLRGKMVTLNDDIWSRLENTDSYDVDSEEDFIALAKQYGKNYKSIMQADLSKLPPALVLEYKPKRYYLVGGNTRLMYYRVKNKRPEVLIGKII